MPATKKSLVVALSAALVVGSIFASSASAEVGNPGPFNAKLEGGQVEIAGSAVKISPQGNSRVTGTVAANGSIMIPQGGIVIEPQTIQAAGLTVGITIRPSAGGTGTIDPRTGAVSLNLKLLFQLRAPSPNLGETCVVGTAANPVNAALSTDRAAGGTAYSSSAGTFIVASRSVKIPPAGGCNGFDALLNGLLGAGGGIAGVKFNFRASPLITTATGGSSGTGPGGGSGTGPGGGSSTTGTGAAAGLSVGSGPLLLRGNKLHLQLACSANEDAGCNGVVRLHGRGYNRCAIVANRKVSMKPGSTGTLVVKLKLTRKIRKKGIGRLVISVDPLSKPAPRLDCARIRGG